MMLAGDSQLRSQAYTDAFKQFRELTTALDPGRANNPYYADSADQKKLERLLEQALFQQAYCLAPNQRRYGPVTYRGAAIQAYDAMAQRFPSSELDAKSLAGKGAVLLQLNRLDEATQTFEQLAADYPDSPEGKSSLYTLATAAVSVGKLDVARGAVERMAADPANYQADMFALVGQLMLDHGLYEQAIRAYEILQATTRDPDLKERAWFGLGRSYQTQGDCAKATRTSPHSSSSTPEPPTCLKHACGWPRPIEPAENTTTPSPP